MSVRKFAHKTANDDKKTKRLINFDKIYEHGGGKVFSSMKRERFQLVLFSAWQLKRIKKKNGKISFWMMFNNCKILLKINLKVMKNFLVFQL